ncbi:uncharacterized protein LOC113494593 [Trichoplusia ni]|uniref:Uncharacterized protein LOC113494593 n=1 Tax=Trichoplusia ni TaxID=7111 RepID=A0A7E5VKH6_TRINI|nr:uncharacterized protein LOC113494593 [Trichoplusia ni]
MAASYSRLNQRRGGSCILCRKGYKSTELDVTKTFAEDKHFEICGIQLDKPKIIVLSIYRTPNSDVKIFFKHLSNILSKLRNKKHKIVICGDFNIDLGASDKNSIQFKELIVNQGLQYHINKPTRLNKCIDNIISNIDGAIGETFNFYLSDHNTAQTITVEHQDLNNNRFYNMTLKDLSKENINKFVNYIGSISFNEICELNNVNDAFNEFHDLLTLFHKLCFPTIKVKIKQNNKKPKWITKGVKISSKTKRLLRYKYYLNKNSENKQQFKTYSRLLKKCINNLQSLCNRRVIALSRNKVKATWDIVKKSMGNVLPREFIGSIIDNSITLTSGSDISNKFNNYFIDIANNNSFNSINNNNTDLLSIQSQDNSIFLEPTSATEIYWVIHSLKNTKSAGYDGITTDLIKYIARYIAPPLEHIINLSFEQGCFPDRLKLSLIKPLHKKGTKSDVNNYRPIALTPILSKIFEKIMYKRLLKYLDKFEILVPQQYGFRQNKSTTMAIFTLVKNILENMNTKKPSCALFLDLSKAFDLVDHNRLIEKLEKYGVRGPAKKWFQSYLSNRQQITRLAKLNKVTNTIEDFDSVPRTNSCGVPQGSILGPLLFLVYINDLPQSISHQCVLFADDTTIIIKSNQPQNLSSQVNKALGEIIKWLDTNKLKINISKTNVIYFKTWKSKPIQLNVSYNTSVIEQIHCSKFLGITVDEHITWKTHIENVCVKINRFVFALRKITCITSMQTALMVYHAYVCSVIRYGIIVWGNSSDISRVFIAQKKCVRAMFNIDWCDTCKPAFQSNNLLTVPCIYIYEISKFVKNNPQFFVSNNNINKRKATHLEFQLPIPRLELFRRSCIYMGPLIYNSLPKTITGLPPNKFCVMLREWLCQQCKFYNCERSVRYRL